MDLWKILQYVVHTEQQVRTLRECLDLYIRVIRTHETMCDYFLGSRGDGFYFKWSDIDILKSLITDYIYMPVIPFGWCDFELMRTLPRDYDSRGNGPVQPHFKYIAIDNECQPGFCKLLCVDGPELADGEYLLQYLHRPSFLNERSRMSFNSNPDKHIHGPCVSTVHGNGLDNCYAIPIHPNFSNVFLKGFLQNFGTMLN